MKMKKIQQRISLDYISDAAKNSKLFLQLLLLNKTEECLDEGEDLQEILINEKIREFDARALCKALQNSTKDAKGIKCLKS